MAHPYFLGMFGADTLSYNMNDYFYGRKTLSEVADDVFSGGINNWYQGLTPAKALVEAPAKRTLYPDVFEPREIKDLGEYIAQTLAVKSEYKWLAGRPVRSNLERLFAYSVDPDSSAYYQTINRKFNFTGRSSTSSQGKDKPKIEAMRFFRDAIRLDDNDAASRYWDLYLSLGGTTKDAKRVVYGMHPMSHISMADEARFRFQMRDHEKDEYLKGLRFYYNELLTPELRDHVQEKRADRMTNMAKRIAILDRMPSDKVEDAERSMQDYMAENADIQAWMSSEIDDPQIRTAIESVLRSQQFLDTLNMKDAPVWTTQEIAGKVKVDKGSRIKDYSDHLKEEVRYNAKVRAAYKFRDAFIGLIQN